MVKYKSNSSSLTLVHGSTMGETSILRPNHTHFCNSEAKTLAKCCILEYTKQDFDEIKLWSESNRKKNEYVLLVSMIKRQQKGSAT